MERAKPYTRVRLAAAMLLAAAAIVSVWAHEVTIKGTVAAIEKTRIQVKPTEETAEMPTKWHLIDAKTKIMRGKDVVTYDRAKIAAGEKVVVIVNHDEKGVSTALEIRLAAR